MEIAGRVENGVVVFVGGDPLPDGTPVSIICPIPATQQPAGEKHRIQLPLVHCQQPGAVHLTNQRIGEILDGEDTASGH